MVLPPTVVAAFLTEDTREGARAFVEKRAPRAGAGERTGARSGRSRPSALGNEERARSRRSSWVVYEIFRMGCPQQLPGLSDTCPHFSHRY